MMVDLLTDHLVDQLVYLVGWYHLVLCYQDCDLCRLMAVDLATVTFGGWQLVQDLICGLVSFWWVNWFCVTWFCVIRIVICVA